MISAPAPDWSPASWQTKEVLQQPDYPDPTVLEAVLTQLAASPPLVTSWEVETLRTHLAEASYGMRFLLQGGDCAERFAECRADVITNRLKILLKMSVVLIYGLKTPVVRVGRFAGQYAKPRSAPMETRDGLALPSYRGDNINAPEFTPEARRPFANPGKMRREVVNARAARHGARQRLLVVQVQGLVARVEIDPSEPDDRPL